MITVDMIRALRRKPDGVIVTDPYGSPEVRSRASRGFADPLTTGEQVVVIDGYPVRSQAVGATDRDIAADLSAQWSHILANTCEQTYFD